MVRQIQHMELINQNNYTIMLYHSDFLLDAQPLPPEAQAHKIVWWGFAFITTLLLTRLVIEQMGIIAIGGSAYGINLITDYIMYPFSLLPLTISSDTTIALPTTIITAVAGYWLIAIVLSKFMKSRKSSSGRIERARTLSRRRYSHL